MRRSPGPVVFRCCSWFCCARSLAATPGEERTALDEYIAAPDPSYDYHLVSTIPGDGVTTYVLEMTSQTWLTDQGSRPPGVEALDDRLQAGRGEDSNTGCCTSPAATTRAARRQGRRR